MKHVLIVLDGNKISQEELEKLVMAVGPLDEKKSSTKEFSFEDIVSNLNSSVNAKRAKEFMKEVILVLNESHEDKEKLEQVINLFCGRLEPLVKDGPVAPTADVCACDCENCRNARGTFVVPKVDLKNLSVIELKEILTLSKVLSQTEEDINKSKVALDEIEERMAILESILISIGIDEDSINSVINLLF